MQFQLFIMPCSMGQCSCRSVFPWIYVPTQTYFSTIPILYRGVPTTVLMEYFGSSSPEKPTLQLPEPLSSTMGALSSLIISSQPFKIIIIIKQYTAIMSISSITTRSKTKLKVVLLGDQSVGKTSVIERYMHDRFEEVEDPTIGVDFVVSNVVRGGKQYRLQLWDTAGQERFKSLIPSYLKDSTCCLVVYDVGVESSAENVRSWVQMYSEHKDESAFIVVVGNKIDVKKFSKQKEKKESFVEQGFQHFQVSAKTGEGVKELFEKVIDLSEQGLKKDILFKEILEVEESQDKKQGEVERKLVDIEEGCTANIIKLDTVAKNKEKSPKKNNKNRNCC